VQKSLSINKEALETMCAGFDKLGLKYVPTLTNFVLVDFERDARYIFEELLKRGVIIRPMRGYGMDTCARISSAPVNHIEYFLEQLKEILKK
jgi:histidinol-phosphate aminotransferase